MGWVVESEEINQSSVRRLPILLWPDRKPRPAAGDGARDELSRLAALYLPRRLARPEQSVTRLAARPHSSSYLDVQLDTLRRMYDGLKGAGHRENFTYITARTLHVMSGRRTSDFGDVRLFKPAELAQALQQRGR
jgi:hypothetical protein